MMLAPIHPHRQYARQQDSEAEQAGGRYGGGTPVRGLLRLSAAKTKNARLDFQSGIRKAAAAYSPTWCSSTIGASELNFSVRNGKRWILTAITAAVFYLREIFQLLLSCLQKRSRAISTGRLKPLLALHLLPINVVVSHDP